MGENSKVPQTSSYTCKSLLNTLGRAVEQLAGCLAEQSKSAVEVKVQC